MARPAAFFLAALIICQVFYNLGVLGYWVANRAYIASELCENRDKPQMHCDGKCYLKKKMANTSGPSSDGLSVPALKKGVELAECPVPIFLPPSVRPVVEKVELPAGEGQCAAGFSRAVFHPPACCG